MRSRKSVPQQVDGCRRLAAAAKGEVCGNFGAPMISGCSERRGLREIFLSLHEMSRFAGLICNKRRGLQELRPQRSMVVTSNACKGRYFKQKNFEHLQRLQVVAGNSCKDMLLLREGIIQDSFIDTGYPEESSHREYYRRSITGAGNS